MTTATNTKSAVPDESAAPSRARSAPFTLDWWMPIAILFPALLLRVINIGSVRNVIDDARLHVLTSYAYSRTGFLGPDTWWSPPLKHLLSAANIAVFGNSEITWRMKGAFFGALSVYLAFLVARRAFRHWLPAVATAALLMLDPFSIAMSHTTHEDLPTVCFILLGVIFFLRWVDFRSDWQCLASGLFFGAAIGLRWYAIIPAGVIALCATWMQRKRLIRAAETLLIFVSAMLSVYLAAYLPWIARGYSLAEWISLQYDALRIQGAGFELSAHLMSLAGADRWFVSWVGGNETLVDNPGRMSSLVNDPWIWILFVPSAILLCYVAVKKDRAEWFAIGATTLATYAFLISSPRPIIIYSAMAVVPLGCVCLGFAIAYLFKRRGWVVLAAAVAWSLLLYPAVSGVYAPAVLLNWLMGLVRS